MTARQCQFTILIMPFVQKNVVFLLIFVQKNVSLHREYVRKNVDKCYGTTDI